MDISYGMKIFVLPNVNIMLIKDERLLRRSKSPSEGKKHHLLFAARTIRKIREPFAAGHQILKKKTPLPQTDGPMDTSDEDDDGSDDDNDDDDLDDDKDEDDQEMEDEGGEEEPLNSEDDVTDDDPTDLFDTDNIVVCQYDKIIRNRNKWKFYLKDGIMNLNGQDYVFQKGKW
ncbi:hypothetical protein NQ318_007643 [Aromia moschata]|uniref:Uncharacterized protein n=1 Tax=Aromia moschata TaxID=1265417 RepID=A0AAV8XI59_9CUCU|nr:hypothetical protein NQ318_007643 [Aromia moschata]